MLVVVVPHLLMRIVSVWDEHRHSKCEPKLDMVPNRQRPHFVFGFVCLDLIQIHPRQYTPPLALSISVELISTDRALD